VISNITQPINSSTTDDYSSNPEKRDNNRFQALADADEPDPTQRANPVIEIIEDAQQPQSGQEGWDNDEDLQDLSDEEGSNESAVVIEDNQRRRKVSLGPRLAHAPNMMLAFNPVHTQPLTNQTIPGRGRGGGLMTTPEITIGLLPPITESPETEHNAAAEDGTQNVDPQTDSITDATTRNASILASTVSPPIEKPERSITTFSFRAQLTWGLPSGTRVNLPQLFREWVAATHKLIPDFALLPFNDDKGQVIVSPDQVPDDNPSFFQDYYYNHRVLNHGNMTGMVHFRCTVSWSKVKRMKDPYFKWLHLHKIYLNLTKFKSATLVVCGFLVGAHPGHFRRDDAEIELRSRLHLPEEFPFQLSSRTITVPKDPGKHAERFSFPAVAIETYTRHAKNLRKSFFLQPKPAEAALHFLYTGPYQFVPMLQSKEWPVQKIYQLAKVHAKLCENLKVLYIENLQDIRNKIGDQGHTLMRGFLGMMVTVNGNSIPLIQSIHNTGKKNVKAVLVHHEHYEYAIEQMTVIHHALLSGVPHDYHDKVFIDNLEAGLTSSQQGTIQSCNSSQNANELLQLYNPQDAEADNSKTAHKRLKPSVISYAAAASGTDMTVANIDQPNQTQTQQHTTISSLTDQDLDQLYD
jgi:hypothetical protein